VAGCRPRVCGRARGSGKGGRSFVNVSDPILDVVVWISLGVIAVTLWAAVVTFGIRGDL